MAVEISVAPRRIMVREIRQISRDGGDREEFLLVPEEGDPIEFHWMNEARSDERESVEQALQRLCKILGIPYEFEELS